MINVNKTYVHLSARKLCAEMKTDAPYAEVTDIMIENFFDSFIDTRKGDHQGCYDAPEVHAQRIASLITIMRKNIILDPVEVFCEYTTGKIQGIDDGWHRIRASYYLNKDVHCKLLFN